MRQLVSAWEALSQAVGPRETDASKSLRAVQIHLERLLAGVGRAVTAAIGQGEIPIDWGLSFVKVFRQNLLLQEIHGVDMQLARNEAILATIEAELALQGEGLPFEHFKQHGFLTDIEILRRVSNAIVEVDAEQFDFSVAAIQQLMTSLRGRYGDQIHVDFDENDQSFGVNISNSARGNACFSVALNPRGSFLWRLIKKANSGEGLGASEFRIGTADGKTLYIMRLSDRDVLTLVSDRKWIRGVTNDKVITVFDPFPSETDAQTAQ